MSYDISKFLILVNGEPCTSSSHAMTGPMAWPKATRYVVLGLLDEVFLRSASYIVGLYIHGHVCKSKTPILIK